MVKIAFCTSKGGVGKTACALELAAGLQRKGNKILLMDMDCQGSLSAGCGFNIESDSPTIKNVLDGNKKLEEVIVKTPFGDLVPNNLLMFDSDRTYTQIGALRKVRKMLPDNLEYDYIIMDTQPSFSFQTLSALIAADYMIVPQLASMFSGLSLRQLNQMITLIKNEENPDLKILGIILNKWTPRTRFNRDFLEVLETVAQEMGTSVYTAKIRQAIAMEESITEHKDIWTYAPDSKIAMDFDAFVSETITRLESMENN